MNKQELVTLREDVDAVIRERLHLGEYNADSQYMMFLLKNIRMLIDHAISQQPKK